MAKLLESTTIGGKSLLDFIYPVGTIYHTEDDSFNPSEYWGGTWEKIVDRFIFGADSNSKQVGGEKTHKLTVSEIPSHVHQYDRPPLWFAELTNGTSNVVGTSGTTNVNQYSGYYTSYTGGVLLTTICLHIILQIFGEEFHKIKFLQNYKRRNLIWQM